jgi:hypothetical protein
MIDIATDFAAVGLGWLEAEVRVGPADAGLVRSLDLTVTAAEGRFTNLRPQDVPGRGDACRL